jgi:hypothetical protein
MREEQTYRHRKLQMKIEAEDVIAYRIDQDLVCEECATEAEKQETMQSLDTLLLRDEYEGSDDLWFCDRCKKRI